MKCLANRTTRRGKGQKGVSTAGPVTDKLGVTIKMPAQQRINGSAKAAKYNFDMTRFLLLHHRRFLNEPIEDMQRELNALEERYGTLDHSNNGSK